MELGCNGLVKIPRVNADTGGLCMLEVLWKMVEAVIDTHILKVVQFHGFLHGFFAGRGAGTAIMELKLAQELENVDQSPHFMLFLYIIHAYNNLDRGRILNTLEGYGTGPKLQDLLAELWSLQEVVNRQNGFHGPQFRVTRGKT